ncbi:hypothetical protein A2U01_0054634, partial [Trifolium medium]|nr:hypothetical protein [Trifolium medium]
GTDADMWQEEENGYTATSTMQVATLAV